MYIDGRPWRSSLAGKDRIKALHRLPDSEYKFVRSQWGKGGFRVGAGGDTADLSVVRGR